MRKTDRDYLIRRLNLMREDSNLTPSQVLTIDSVLGILMYEDVVMKSRGNRAIVK